MGGLKADTEVREEGGKFAATFSRNWEVWGPNGGYIASIALRAAGKVAPPDHRPATFSCQYLSAGQFADVEIDVEPVRKGRNAWCLNVMLSQNAKRVLQAQVWTTNKAGGPEKIDRKMPDVPHHRALRTWAELQPPDAEGPHYSFWDNIDGKPIAFLGRGEADPRGSVEQEWYRYRDFAPTADPFLDFARALVFIDTLQWPAFCRGLHEPPDYVAPSMDVTAWFHSAPGAAQWLLVDAHADTATGGLIHGGVHVWSDDGRLIASGGSNLLHVARAAR
jgi:acyl-CoA thioesterase II